jgi:predicted dehydrogenase
MNGSIGSIHLDYIRRTYDASLEIIGENGTIRWNYQNHFIEWYVAAENRWQSIKWEKLDSNQMYVDEMKHFLKVIDNQEESICPAGEAVKVLKIALAVKEAASHRKVIQL